MFNKKKYILAAIFYYLLTVWLVTNNEMSSKNSSVRSENTRNLLETKTLIHPDCECSVTFHNALLTSELPPETDITCSKVWTKSCLTKL